jgi:hypothetical protein
MKMQTALNSVMPNPEGQHLLCRVRSKLENKDLLGHTHEFCKKQEKVKDQGKSRNSPETSLNALP